MTLPEKDKCCDCNTQEEHICPVSDVIDEVVPTVDVPVDSPVDVPVDSFVDETRTPSPSRMTNGKYAVLMETNGNECESWMYFIRHDGNEENLQYLHDQLESVEWYIMDDLSTFDLDLDHLVSATTAKEMTKTELNSYAFHRKFDGILDKIKFGFKKRDDDENKMCKVFDQLGYGQIEDFVNDEDLDEEDLTDSYDTDDESDSGDESESGSESDSDSGSESESESESEPEKKKRAKGIPPSLINSNLPRWAKAKRAKRHIPLEKNKL